MFVLIDYTVKPPYIYNKNDIKDVADIVVDITGNEKEGDKVVMFCEDMRFGDTHISRLGYVIDCVRDEEVTQNDKRTSETNFYRRILQRQYS